MKRILVFLIAVQMFYPFVSRQLQPFWDSIPPRWYMGKVNVVDLRLLTHYDRIAADSHCDVFRKNLSSLSNNSQDASLMAFTFEVQLVVQHAEAASCYHHPESVRISASPHYRNRDYSLADPLLDMEVELMHAGEKLKAVAM
ncbi:Uncharacterised protein [Zhongshania aliphaticivorans]|uniref:Uncharacterized protein n=2 Tax=Zhongshania aliphaticivorans TaxID=1470434 RepID=A0A5S9PI94_9GAMM|nr:Uncharacterised protein [Zhongshania aliphaticivorans]